jgi:hypothetical protein
MKPENMSVLPTITAQAFGTVLCRMQLSEYLLYSYINEEEVHPFNKLILSFLCVCRITCLGMFLESQENLDFWVGNWGLKSRLHTGKAGILQL